MEPSSIYDNVVTRHSKSHIYDSRNTDPKSEAGNKERKAGDLPYYLCQEGSQLEAKELAKTCWALAKLSMSSAPLMDRLSESYHGSGVSGLSWLRVNGVGLGFWSLSSRLKVWISTRLSRLYSTLFQGQAHRPGSGQQFF